MKLYQNKDYDYQTHSYTEDTRITSNVYVKSLKITPGCCVKLFEEDEKIFSKRGVSRTYCESVSCLNCRPAKGMHSLMINKGKKNKRRC